MALDAGSQLFKDLQEIISKHFTAMQNDIHKTGNDAMIDIFPSTLLQLLIGELFRTSNPIVVTATVLSILTQKVAHEAGKIAGDARVIH